MMLTRAAFTGWVREYDVVVHPNDTVEIRRDETVASSEHVSGLWTFVTNAKAVRLGWGQFPDGDEVIYLYDKLDAGFGYAVNLHDPQCSEWGYAPVA